MSALAVLVALGLGAAPVAAPQPLSDKIDVSPGRDPEGVRAELRKHLDELVQLSGRAYGEAPATADGRTRLRFHIDAAGRVAADDAHVQSAALDPAWVSLRLPGLVNFGPAAGAVEVRYEFSVAPDAAATASANARRSLRAAAVRACAALAREGQKPGELEHERAKAAAIPLTAATLEDNFTSLILQRAINSVAELQPAMLHAMLCSLHQEDACPAVAHDPHASGYACVPAPVLVDTDEARRP